MLSRLQAGQSLTPGDVARRWGQTLIDPQVPTTRRIRDEDAMLIVFTQQPEWAAIFASGMLSHLVQTLPASDPWRHLSATITTPGDTLRRGFQPPDRTGADLEDGRAFGGNDHPRYPGVDPDLDVEFGALSDGLSREAAALFAFATDGWNTTYKAMGLIRSGALAEAVHGTAPVSDVRIAALAGEQTWLAAEAALRWASHRRRLIHASQPTTRRSHAADVALGGSDELPRDLCAHYANHTDEQMHMGAPPATIGVAEQQAGALVESEIAAERLTEPVFWPSE